MITLGLIFILISILVPVIAAAGYYMGLWKSPFDTSSFIGSRPPLIIMLLQILLSIAVFGFAAVSIGFLHGI